MATPFHRMRNPPPDRCRYICAYVCGWTIRLQPIVELGILSIMSRQARLLVVGNRLVDRANRGGARLRADSSVLPFCLQ